MVEANKKMNKNNSVRKKGLTLRSKNLLALALASSMLFMSAGVSVSYASGTHTSIKVFELEEATIEEMQQAMDAGALSSTELTVLYLNRIYTYDLNGIKLNSIPVLNKNVLDEALEADRLRSEGQKLGPLHGIPYTVKDSYKVKGMTVASGSPAFANLTANEDAFTVQQIRKSGGVLIGKTNMPPMAAGGMQRGVYGRAESPYNANYLTAAWFSGSSNGSATSTAANFAAFGMGEETVSSGRSPASNNGLVAYTPSRGMLSIRGNWPLFPVRDVVVPHTRTVEDMLRVLDVIQVDDPITQGDFWRDQKAVQLPTVASLRPESFLQLKDTQALSGKRIGVPKMYIGKDFGGTRPIKIRPSILELWEQAAEDLRAQGAEVVEVDFPVQSNYENDRVTSQTMVERGFVPAGWAEQEWGYLNPYLAEEFLKGVGDPNYPSWTEVDPKTVFPNPPGSVDEARDRENANYKATIDTIKEGVRPVSELPGFESAMKGLEKARKVDFEDWMTSNNLDFVVFPANADIGKADADVNPTSYDEAWANGNYFSNTNHMLRHLGIPSVSVSMGTMKDTGMPVNLTFIGAAYTDNDLLRYAYDYEQATHNRTIATRTPALSDETLRYSAQTAIPADKRKDKDIPDMTLTAKLIGNKLSIRGTSQDQSQIDSTRVYANGIKATLSGGNEKWSASIPIDRYQKEGPFKAETLTIIALSKDEFGNTAALMQQVNLPIVEE
ncbi:amidase [Paenibacillus sp. TSA_86.1]|jgi:amidase|uniref:amidase n=1 Tax=Paenibacillus sp. TSA_86.1 TaxID=3415649 RepID=UPI0021BEB6B7|nr:amidase [Paenibacillus xylanexedens]